MLWKMKRWRNTKYWTTRTLCNKRKRLRSNFKVRSGYFHPFWLLIVISYSHPLFW